MAITCKTCGKVIRGNAAAEEYDEVKQRYFYTCKACDKVFKKALKLAEKP